MGYEEVKKTWQEKKIKDENDLKIALSNFQILFAYNSNKIENPKTTYHDTREIFENGLLSIFNRQDHRTGAAEPKSDKRDSQAAYERLLRSDAL